MCVLVGPVGSYPMVLPYDLTESALFLDRGAKCKTETKDLQRK